MGDDQINFPMNPVVTGEQLAQQYGNNGGAVRRKGTATNSHTNHSYNPNPNSGSRIGLKFSFKDLETEPPAWPADQQAIVYGNLTPDLTQDWAVWNALFYFMSVILTTAVYGFLVASAYALFDDDDNFGHVVTRSIVVYGVVYILVRVFGKWTGALLNPWIVMVTTFTFILFGRDHKDYKRANVWYELLKMVLFIIAQFVGYLVGIAFIATWAEGGVATSDCLVTEVAACRALPDLGVGISVATATWMEFWGGLFICMGYALGYTLHSSKKKDMHETIATIVAFMYGLMHLLWGPFAGGAFNIFYWLALAIYTNEYSNATVYTWSFVLGCVTVFIVQAIHYWVSNRVRALKLKASAKSAVL